MRRVEGMRARKAALSLGAVMLLLVSSSPVSAHTGRRLTAEMDASGNVIVTNHRSRKIEVYIQVRWDDTDCADRGTCSSSTAAGFPEKWVRIRAGVTKTVLFSYPSQADTAEILHVHRS